MSVPAAAAVAASQVSDSQHWLSNPDFVVGPALVQATDMQADSWSQIERHVWMLLAAAVAGIAEVYVAYAPEHATSVLTS